MSKALQRKLQRTEASRQKLIEAHGLALVALADARRCLEAIEEFGDDVIPCCLCEADERHLDSCPFQWAKEALKARS